MEKAHMTTIVRYITYKLMACERPTTRYEFWVTGSGQFPWDMLRYDAAWPADTEAAMAMADEHWGTPHGRWGKGESRRSLRLYSHHEPTIGRWASFLWSVGADRIPC
jgi:hypothetical protein